MSKNFSKENPPSILQIIITDEVTITEAIKALEEDDYFSRWLVFISLVSSTSLETPLLAKNDIVAFTLTNKQDLFFLQEILREKFSWIVAVNFIDLIAPPSDQHPILFEVFRNDYSYAGYTIRQMFQLIYGRQLRTDLDSIPFDNSSCKLGHSALGNIKAARKYSNITSWSNQYISVGKLVDNMTHQEFNTLGRIGAGTYEKFFRYLYDNFLDRESSD